MDLLKLDDFLMYNFLSCVQMNPVGRGAAYLASSANTENNSYSSDLYYVEKLIPENRSIRLTQSGKVKSYAWVDGTHLVYTEVDDPSDNAPYGRTKVFRTEIYVGEPECCFELDGALTLVGALDGGKLAFTRVDNLTHQQALEGLTGDAYLKKAAELKDAEEVATVFDEYPFWFNGRGVINKTRKAIYVCDPDGKNLTRITPKGFRSEYIAVEGARIAYTGVFVEPVENYLTGAYVYDDATGKTVCVQPEGVCHVEGVTLWNGCAVTVSSKMDHFSVSQCPDIIVIDPDTGARNQLCDYRQELSVGNPVGSDCRLGGGYTMKASGDWLYFISGIEDASHLWRVNLSGKFEPVFEKDGSVDCFDVRGDMICMVAMHDMRLQELYAVGNGSAQRITSWNDDFYLSKPPVVPEKLNFVNTDGVEIHGFVLKPVGYQPGKKYPAILDIHGGPHLSYGAVYYHEMQYWAYHGYFVIYCNPRGGEGRGNEFGLLSGKFGTIDFDDLMAFCDEALKAYPDMDGEHMGVTGGSYGGFMTNWIIGHTNRFAAAASQRSISNFVSMEGTSDIGTLFAKGQVMATTHTNVEKMWQHSPLKYADTCTTPTLFIHAEQDYRCWMVEALQMYTALINNGVRTRLCLFHNENHELSRGGKPKGRVRRLTEITNWMDQFLKAN